MVNATEATTTTLSRTAVVIALIYRRARSKRSSSTSSATSMRGTGAPISAAVRRRAAISRSSESMVSRSRMVAKRSGSAGARKPAKDPWRGSGAERGALKHLAFDALVVTSGDRHGPEIPG